MSEKQVFKTKIDLTFFVLHFGTLAVISFFTIAVYISSSESSTFSMMLGFWLVAFVFTITSFLFLRVFIKDHFLVVKVIFNIYKVDIKTITTINAGKTMWFGLHKYGTATKGLIISSKFKNDLYITPENESLFLQKLSDLNPNIQFTKG